MSQLTNWFLTLGGTPVQYQFNGVNVGTAGQATTIDFTGAGVSLSILGNVLTVNIPGGGGPAIPTITTNTTLAVPADYPTINDALDWVRARVRLNAATVTIEVDGSAYSANEQIVIGAEDLSFVQISAISPVSVDTTGFVPGPLGVPAFVSVLSNAKFGGLAGVWNKTAGPAVVIGLINIASEIVVLSATITGFFQNYSQNGGLAFLNGCAFLDSIAVGVIGAGGGIMNIARATIDNSGTSGAGITALAGFEMAGNTLAITTTTGVPIAGTRSTFNLGAVSVVSGQCSSVLNMQASRGSVSMTNVTTDCTSEIFIADNSDVFATITGTLTLTGSNNPGFARSNGARLTTNVAAISGTSSGSPGYVLGAGILQDRNPATTTGAFSGAYIPAAVNTPSADGLILA